MDRVWWSLMFGGWWIERRRTNSGVDEIIGGVYHFNLCLSPRCSAGIVLGVAMDRTRFAQPTKLDRRHLQQSGVS